MIIFYQSGYHMQSANMYHCKQIYITVSMQHKTHPPYILHKKHFLFFIISDLIIFPCSYVFVAEVQSLAF